MIDSNERLTFLNSRHTTNNAKRTISTVLAQFIELRNENNSTDKTLAFLQEKANATKNMLFLKYTGIEYESLFQSLYLNKKMD